MGQSPHKLNITKIPAISTNFFNIIKKKRGAFAPLPKRIEFI